MSNNDFFNGLFVGASQVFVGYPFDTIKTVFQTGKRNIGWNVYRGSQYQFLNNSIVNGALFSFNTEIYKYTESYYISGIVSGFISSFIICPIEQCKVKAQLNNTFRLPLYSGIKPTIYRESLACSLYFGNYYQLKDMGFNSFIAGAISGTSSWLFTYPFDIYKTQMQAGMKLDLYCKQAWKALPITLIRAFLVNGVSFSLYNYLHDIENK